MDYPAVIWYGLTIKCYGWLTGIKFYTKRNGTFHFDLWKAEGDDFILYYTRQIHVPFMGAHIVPVTEKISVEPGILLGMHSMKGTSGLVSFGFHSEYPVRRYLEKDTTVWEIGALRASELKRVGDSARLPSLDVQITRGRVHFYDSPGCTIDSDSVSWELSTCNTGWTSQIYTFVGNLSFNGNASLNIN